jgi:hypothetical protein
MEIRCSFLLEISGSPDHTTIVQARHHESRRAFNPQEVKDRMERDDTISLKKYVWYINRIEFIS